MPTGKICHLVGPNAIGKSTAVVRWAQRYGGLTVASLDLLRKEAPDKAGKQAYLKAHSNGTVLVAESVYTNQIVVTSCDSSGHGVTLQGDRQLEGYDWKGDTATKRGCVERLRREASLAITESARTTTALQANADEPVIIVVCPAAKLGAHMRARCAAKGKTFRTEYWTDKKLECEASKRYLNFAAKYLQPEQYKVFWIRDQAQDWPAVDAWFGQLYRRLHNSLLREREAGKC